MIDIRAIFLSVWEMQYERNITTSISQIARKTFYSYKIAKAKFYPSIINFAWIKSLFRTRFIEKKYMWVADNLKRPPIQSFIYVIRNAIMDIIAHCYILYTIVCVRVWINEY